MRNLLAALLLALAAAPSSAEAFRYVSFRELRTGAVSAQVAQAKRLKTLVALFFDSEDSVGWSLKEQDVQVVFLWDDLSKGLVQELPYLAGLAKGPVLVEAKDVRLRFEQTREAFYQALKAISDADHSDPDLRLLADWGYGTWVKLDPAIDLHSERLISSSDYDALKLK